MSPWAAFEPLWISILHEFPKAPKRTGVADEQLPRPAGSRQWQGKLSSRCAVWSVVVNWGMSPLDGNIRAYCICEVEREPREGQPCTKSMAHLQPWPLTPPGKVLGQLVMLHAVQTESQLVLPCWSLQPSGSKPRGPDVLWPSPVFLSILCAHPSRRYRG